MRAPALGGPDPNDAVAAASSNAVREEVYVDLLIIRLALRSRSACWSAWSAAGASAPCRPGAVPREFGRTGLPGSSAGFSRRLRRPSGAPSSLDLGSSASPSIFGWFKWQEEKQEGSLSVTGAVAALAVFGLGGLAVVGDYRAAAADGVALAGVLASREPLHRLLRGSPGWSSARAPAGGDDRDRPAASPEPANRSLGWRQSLGDLVLHRAYGGHLLRWLRRGPHFRTGKGSADQRPRRRARLLARRSPWRLPAALRQASRRARSQPAPASQR